jgi:hypothetical protein
MSSDAQPIPPARFREAIKDLPVGSLHAKAAELRNSIAHLQSSNDQLKEFADGGDRDCAEAITENEEVMARMTQRIEMLKGEVEGRGLRWYEDHDKGELDGGDAAPVVNRSAETNGQAGAEDTASAGVRRAQDAVEAPPPRTNGRLTDEELQRLLAERLGEPESAEEDGVYL